MLRISEHQPQTIAACVEGMVQAHAEGWLKPHVHKEYTREQLPDALEALGGGGTMGKVVVRW
jgi:NADPH:quinone reductase-like Zn-dependent oxidoreductase